MKTKVILISIMVIFSFSSEAQIKNWLNKQKQKLQKNEYVQKTQQSLKQLDPSDYIKRKLNEKFNIDEYVANINRTYNQLKRSANDNIHLFNNENVKFQDRFVKLRNTPDDLNLLASGESTSLFPTNAFYNNREFKLYAYNGGYVALSQRSMPVDKNLEKVIMTEYWAGHMQDLNPEYISNLKSLARISAEFYGYMLMFYDAVLNIFNKLASIGYGGMNATSVIDKYSSTLGYNFSLSGTESNFRSYRNELKAMQDLSNRIYSNSDQFMALRESVRQTKGANYDEVIRAMEGFKSISKDISVLADKVENQKEAVAKTRQSLSKLSNFYGISFLEKIGNLYKYLEDYYAMIEAGTRKHSMAFGNFVDQVNTESSQLYNDSKKMYDRVSGEQIRHNLPYMNDYMAVLKDIQGSETRNLTRDKFVIYLTQLNNKLQSLNAAKEVDFILFSNELKQTTQQYDDFPVAEAKNYYAYVLKSIDDKQIIGGDYYESHMKSIAILLESIQKDKSGISKLLNTGKQLDTYMADAEKSNTTFYIVLVVGLVVIIGIVVFVAIRKRKSASI